MRRLPALAVEVDAMPGGFVCSASLRAVLDQAEVKDVLAGRRPVRKLFSASLSSNTSLTGEGDWHAAQVEPPKGPCQWRDWSFAWEVSERGRNSLH
jgi:hypothetical protein